MNLSERRECTIVLREVILEHLSLRVGKGSMELMREVEDDYGPVSARRDSAMRAFLRHLAALIKMGCVRRDREWGLEQDAWLPIYFLIHRNVRDLRREPHCCSECGVKGSNARWHPEHARLKAAR